MQAAAPQALPPTLVQKNGAAAKTAAGPVSRSAQPAADAFFRIVAAKLGLKDARGPRPQAAAAAQVGHTPAAGQGAGGLPEQPGGPAGQTAAGQGADASAKKRAARARGFLAEAALEWETGSAPGSREAAGGLPSRQSDSRKGGAEAAVPVLAGRKAAEPRVYVLDLRTNAGQASGDAKTAARGVQGQASAREADGPLAGLQAGARAAAGREGAASAGDPRAGRPQGSAGAPGPFETALERLRGMAGSELVKTSGIILRDGGGEIRLVLKPESLGSVRIRMNLVDNGIEGRIIVDNAAVKQVLDGSLDTLTRALTAQGFQSASLEVAVGGQNADGGRTAQEPHTALRRETAEGFERNVPGIESLSLGELLVNLFV